MGRGHKKEHVRWSPDMPTARLQRDRTQAMEACSTRAARAPSLFKSQSNCPSVLYLTHHDLSAGRGRRRCALHPRGLPCLIPFVTPRRLSHQISLPLWWPPGSGLDMLVGGYGSGGHHDVISDRTTKPNLRQARPLHETNPRYLTLFHSWKLRAAPRPWRRRRRF